MARCKYNAQKIIKKKKINNHKALKILHPIKSTQTRGLNEIYNKTLIPII